MGTRIFYEGEAMRIDGHLLTGEESLSCNIDPHSKKTYLLIKGEGFEIRLDSAEEKNCIINFYLKKIKDPVLKAVVQNFRERPNKIPLPYKTLETLNDVFSPKRIMKKQLTPISSDEKKELQLRFEFTEGAELYRHEYKVRGINYKWIIPKELTDKKGVPIPALMQKAFYMSIGMGIEQGSKTIRFTLGDKLKWLGYTKEDTESNPEIFEKLRNAEAHLAGSIIISEEGEFSSVREDLEKRTSGFPVVLPRAKAG